MLNRLSCDSVKDLAVSRILKELHGIGVDGLFKHVTEVVGAPWRGVLRRDLID